MQLRHTLQKQTGYLKASMKNTHSCLRPCQPREHWPASCYCGTLHIHEVTPHATRKRQDPASWFFGASSKSQISTFCRHTWHRYNYRSTMYWCLAAFPTTPGLKVELQHEWLWKSDALELEAEVGVKHHLLYFICFPITAVHHEQHSLIALTWLQSSTCRWTKVNVSSKL